ncbi:TolC family protein, partial [Chitinimonas sp.]|uniref:TolC family protein n=1 Tax=Chitinimonas sp. TaxID=1934313 RepID=UPI0035B0C8F8
MIRPAALTLALALAGCAANPPMAKLDLPASANASLPAGIDAWWRSLNDATLSQLIDEALAHNADVLLAAERIGQSQAVLDETRINLLPDANLSSSANRRKPSEETTAKGQSGASTSYKTGIGVSYEIDLWGRLSLARDAARAQLAASGYAREVSRSAVAAQTAKSYFSLLALDSEVSLLGKTLQTRDEALRVQQARFKAGASGEYELKLIEAERAAVAASLPKLMAARSQAETALAVLLGRSPREVVEGSIQRGSALDSLAATPDIPAALPTELLSRRPDVQQAAMQFNAADAELSEARRRYFPSISLSGFF